MAGRWELIDEPGTEEIGDDVLEVGGESRWSPDETRLRSPQWGRPSRPSRRQASLLVLVTALIVSCVGVVSVLTRHGPRPVPGYALQPAASGAPGSVSVRPQGAVTVQWPVSNTLAFPVTITAATAVPGPLRQTGAVHVIGASEAVIGNGGAGQALPYQIPPGAEVDVTTNFAIDSCADALKASAPPEVAFRVRAPGHRSTELNSIPLLPEGFTDGNWLTSSLTSSLACTLPQAVALLTAEAPSPNVVLTGAPGSGPRAVTLPAVADNNTRLQGSCVGTGSIPMGEQLPGGLGGGTTITCERYYAPGVVVAFGGPPAPLSTTSAARSAPLAVSVTPHGSVTWVVVADWNTGRQLSGPIRPG